MAAKADGGVVGNARSSAASSGGACTSRCRPAAQPATAPPHAAPRQRPLATAMFFWVPGWRWAAAGPCLLPADLASTAAAAALGAPSVRRIMCAHGFRGVGAAWFPLITPDAAVLRLTPPPLRCLPLRTFFGWERRVDRTFPTSLQQPAGRLYTAAQPRCVPARAALRGAPPGVTSAHLDGVVHQGAAQPSVGPPLAGATPAPRSSASAPSPTPRPLHCSLPQAR